jgi:DNA polymerase-3 subunit beta
MKFSCALSGIKQAVSIVEKAVPTRTSLPVLEHIYMSLVGNQLTLRSHDLEFGIHYTIPVSTEQEGTILVTPVEEPSRSQFTG